MKNHSPLNTEFNYLVSCIILINRPKRIGARSLEVKYTMHDKYYPEVDEFAHHDIDEEGIATSHLPYIISLYEIYSRLYPKDK